MSVGPARLEGLRSRRPAGTIARELLRRPLAVAASAYLLILLIASYGSGVLAPHDPVAAHLDMTGQGPSAQFWLGTDSLGRDVLSRLMVGGIDAINDVLVALVITIALGSLLGILAGYLGGAVDTIVMRWAEITMAMPALVILLVVLMIFPGNSTAAMVAFGILLVSPISRVIRAATLSVRHELHIDAARLAGLGPGAIMRRHVLPRISGTIVVQATLAASAILLFSTSIAFLGFGPPPPAPTWGGMITEASKSLSTNPWLLVPTGAVIILTVLSFNALGDSIRDILVERWAGPPATAASRSRRGAKAGRAASRSAASSVAPTGADQPDTVLEVTGLSVTVAGVNAVTVVDAVSLSVRAGETLGLVGESGCGKTMTARAMIGLLPVGAEVSAGSVRIGGLDLVTLSERELARLRGSLISYISQDPMLALDPSFTVGSLVGEAVARHEGLRGRARRRRVAELLTAVRLRDVESVARLYPHQISGGMAQRVAIARALAGRPRLLIADEPTTALDVTVQSEILDLLEEIQAETGMSIIFVTHDWGVVADICDRATVMYAGQVVETASVQTLFEAPLHPYTAGLLGSTPQRAQPGQPLPMLPGSVPPPDRWPTGCHFAARCRFATEECTDGPIPIASVGPSHSSRCIRVDELRKDMVV
ncbi:dipeptide/oligopeptide/nickel ABC transporter permease/ATP-binding protein [Microbacterium sp.]|uniref:dipeptide/oligopeptide/nickel ABC transporter permease/ATP-binding protein n=1 Tax=Microbacterium sp. TaxID=51671 RepID=UPI001AC892F5|nr:dipeptide/oligopeptide/nickel ABC transporter permease/ATP-binding protein [Microbacterium sp.]MBN9192032.1 dipeptide/oligopeptide/nickel ABC transporter permease/ATP-binding protein [Microbacterium sp.]